jgi:hypothetical protein
MSARIRRVENQAGFSGYVLDDEATIGFCRHAGVGQTVRRAGL